MKFTLIFSLLILCAACGGGSSSDNTAAPVKNPPKSPTPDLWTATKPDYSGKTELFYLSEEESPEFAYELLDSLDFITSLGFTNSPHFLALNKASGINDEVVCESGSTETTVQSNNSKLEVEFNQCRFDGVIADGTLRASVDNTQIFITVVVDLTITEELSDESFALTGFYKTNENTESTYNLLFKEKATNQEILFEDFSISRNNRDLQYQGDIYLSDRGKLTVSTVGSSQSSGSEGYFVELNIASENTIIARAEPEVSMTVRFSSSHIPVSIPLDSSEYIVFGGAENASPVAKITTNSITSDRNVPIVLSAIESRDADYEFLTYDWSVIEQPEGSTVAIPQGVEGEFSGDLPGEYIVRLSVRDPSGESGITEQIISVLKNAPEGDIEFISEGHYIGNPFNASIAVNNDSFDGPFTYHLKYGPANMAVDSAGNITWNGVLPDYGIPTDVNFAIVVANSDRHTEFTSTVAMQSQHEVSIEHVLPTIVTSALDGFSREINSPYLYGPNTVYQLTVDSNSQPIWNNLFPLVDERESKYKYHTVADANGDGTLDFWFSSMRYIAWKDGRTGQINKVIEFESDVPVNYLMVLDYDQDGDNELLYEGASKLHLFGIRENSEIMTFSPSWSPQHLDIKLVCDANDDGYQDVYLDDQIFDLKNDERIFDIKLGKKTQFYNDGTGKCLFITEHDDNLMLVDGNSENNKIILSQYPLNEFSPFIVGNFDNDPSDEVLVASTFENNYEKLRLDNIKSGEVTSSLLPSAEGLSNFSDFLVVDINGDGIDELTHTVNYSDNAGNFYADQLQVISYFLNPDDTIEVRKGKSTYRDYFQISQWDNSNILLDDQFGSRVIIQATAGQELVQQNLLTRSGTASRIENGVTYVYKNTQDQSSLVKQDLNGTVQWTVDNEEGFGNITLLSERVLFATTGYNASNGYLFDTESGEEIYSNSNSEGVFNLQISSYLSDDGTLYFLDAHRLGLLKIDSDLEVQELADTNSLNNLITQQSYISFVQFDKDDVFEMIIRNGESTGTYKVFDIETLSLLPLDVARDGIAALPVSEGRGCFDWDDKCRNVIVLKTFENDAGGYRVIDKFSGIVIWSSPAFTGTPLYDVGFLSNSDVISTMAVTENSVKIFSNAN